MFGVDRTSNRAWKRRRNWVIEARSVMRLNGYEKNEIIRRVIGDSPRPRSQEGEADGRRDPRQKYILLTAPPCPGIYSPR